MYLLHNFRKLYITFNIVFFIFACFFSQFNELIVNILDPSIKHFMISTYLKKIVNSAVLNSIWFLYSYQFPLLNDSMFDLKRNQCTFNLIETCWAHISLSNESAYYIKYNKKNITLKDCKLQATYDINKNTFWNHS